MITKNTYKGILNGVYGIYCGFEPEGLEVQEVVPVYYPDEGNIFIKNGIKFSCVVLQDSETIEDYQEVLDKEVTDDNI